MTERPTSGQVVGSKVTARGEVAGKMSDVIALLRLGQTLVREARQVRSASAKALLQANREHLEELAALLEDEARKLELRAGNLNDAVDTGIHLKDEKPVSSGVFPSGAKASPSTVERAGDAFHLPRSSGESAPAGRQSLRLGHLGKGG